jgi:hypothetical protein
MGTEQYYIYERHLNRSQRPPSCRKPSILAAFDSMCTSWRAGGVTLIPTHKLLNTLRAVKLTIDCTEPASRHNDANLTVVQSRLLQIDQLTTKKQKLPRSRPD